MPQIGRPLSHRHARGEQARWGWRMEREGHSSGPQGARALSCLSVCLADLTFQGGWVREREKEERRKREHASCLCC